MQGEDEHATETTSTVPQLEFKPNTTFARPRPIADSLYKNVVVVAANVAPKNSIINPFVLGSNLTVERQVGFTVVAGGKDVVTGPAVEVAGRDVLWTGKVVTGTPVVLTGATVVRGIDEVAGAVEFTGTDVS